MICSFGNYHKTKWYLTKDGLQIVVSLYLWQPYREVLFAGLRKISIVAGGAPLAREDGYRSKIDATEITRAQRVRHAVDEVQCNCEV